MLLRRQAGVRRRIDFQRQFERQRRLQHAQAPLGGRERASPEAVDEVVAHARQPGGEPPAGRRRGHGFGSRVHLAPGAAFAAHLAGHGQVRTSEIDGDQTRLGAADDADLGRFQEETGRGP
ncbi:MAG: hypothetical protein IPI34_04920 [bacterium]|nr:hypothetical protein [bacterium]